ncbi:CPBP family intramembrane glutamic endopeptidase [Maricaulis sp. CAU 1757]
MTDTVIDGARAACAKPALVRPERMAAGLELAFIVAFAVASKALVSLVAWRFAGPISLIITLGLVTWLMHRRGETWRGFGLVAFNGWRPLALLLPQALLGVVAILGTGVLAGWVGISLGWWPDETPTGVMDRWGNIVGNLPVYLLWMAIAWIAAGLGEEMLFRGYLITRIGHVLPGGAIMSVLAVALAASLFGLGHVYYQGLRGFVQTGLIGLALGLLFLAYKRNLWPLVIAHGLVDSLVFTALYLELDI